MTGKRKAFVILSPGFASSEEDTTCLPMQQQFVKSISKLHPELQIIVLAFQYPYRVDSYQWFDAVVYSFNGRNRGGIARLLLQKKIFGCLKRIKSEYEITGILSFWLNECAFLGKSFAKKNDIKHYCWLLGQDARKGNKYVKRIKPQSSELVALSDFLQDEFERNYSIRPKHVVAPGLNKYNVDPVEKDIDIVGVGSLIPLKQFDIFLEMVYELKKEFPDIKTVLVGDGPMKKELLDRSGELGLGDSIVFEGEKPHNEVLQILSRSKVLVHPSSYEGFPGVCLEALGAGAKVVSFIKPMNHSIANWYVVKTKNEMKLQVLSLLTEKTEHQPAVWHSMEQTAKEMLDLF